MKTALQISGYNINHKESISIDERSSIVTGKHQNLLRLGKIPQVFPSQPFEVLNIKLIWAGV
jgi:hypothetical protein